MSHFIEFENVCKFYTMGGNTIAAADHISFFVEKGEFCVIVGPSGAGKTMKGALCSSFITWCRT